nr:putative reverse transcriptase domain-containing protein [Tanacetum cinerariifolium]
YHPGKANVVADALSRKSGMIAEAHSSPCSVHPGSTKMYHDLKQHFWWSGMKRDVATFVSRCLICQQTRRRHDAIWVVMDRLTKFAHFLPNRKDYSVSKLAETFQQETVGERVIEGPEMIEVTNEKVAVAKEKLKEARTRQKSYADKHHRHFGIKSKLSPRFIEPFEILDRVGEVSYRLALPPLLSHVYNVFHVSLIRGYKYHPLYVISYPLDQIRADLSYVEEPEAILDRQDRVMRNKTILFVKII